MLRVYTIAEFANSRIAVEDVEIDDVTIRAGDHVLELQIVFDTLFRRIPTLRLAKPADRLPYKDDAFIYGIHRGTRDLAGSGMTKILDPTRTDLYTTTGLRRLGSRLRPGGAFGLWSDDAPGRDLPRQRRYPGPADLDEAVRAFEERKWARADKWAKMRRRPARDAW